MDIVRIYGGEYLYGKTGHDGAVGRPILKKVSRHGVFPASKGAVFKVDRIKYHYAQNTAAFQLRYTMFAKDAVLERNIVSYLAHGTY